MIDYEYNAIEIESEKDLAMTAIVALKEGEDSILFSADTQITEDNAFYSETSKKLQRHPKNIVAWSISGNHTIWVEQFNQWLKSADCPQTWGILGEQAIGKLSIINATLRRLAQQSGVKPDDNITVNCLLVGWLEKPDIYEVNDIGQVTSYWDSGFHAIGHGKRYAYSAYKTLSHMKDIEPLKRIAIIMEVVTTTALACGKPYDVWRITRDKIEDITELAVNSIN
jgi:ATP-dependent protease HslVU (ClpYQ) peptidase subunit